MARNTLPVADWHYDYILDARERELDYNDGTPLAPHSQFSYVCVYARIKRYRI